MSASKTLFSIRTQAIFTTILAVLLILTLWQMQQLDNQQRQDYQNAVYFVEANAQLAKASDYLTAEARAFSVTKKVEHLNNYWDEVNVVKRRDAAVAVLEQLNGDGKLVRLLVKSKANSDALIQTELASMRAVLESMNTPVADMPKPVAEFSLSGKVNAMSNAEKLNYAQQILFDKQYYRDKRSIMAPLAEFQSLIKEGIEADMTNQQSQAVHTLYMAKAMALLLVILGINIVRVSGQSQKTTNTARKSNRKKA